MRKPMKKPMKKQELLTILDRWNKTLEQMNEFGVIVTNIKSYHMSSEEFFDGRFDKAIIAIEDFDSVGGAFPYKAIVSLDEYTFTCLITEEEFAKLVKEKKVEL